MAVGETSGQAGPRRLITAGGGRRRAEGFATEEAAAEAPTGAQEEAAPAGGAGTDEEVEAPVADLLPSPTEPDELERQLTRDEEMERQSRHEHHEAPHFRKESD